MTRSFLLLSFFILALVSNTSFANTKCATTETVQPKPYSGIDRTR